MTKYFLILSAVLLLGGGCGETVENKILAEDIPLAPVCHTETTISCEEMAKADFPEEWKNFDKVSCFFRDGYESVMYFNKRCLCYGQMRNPKPRPIPKKYSEDEYYQEFMPEYGWGSPPQINFQPKPEFTKEVCTPDGE